MESLPLYFSGRKQSILYKPLVSTYEEDKMGWCKGDGRTLGLGISPLVRVVRVVRVVRGGLSGEVTHEMKSEW